MKHLRTFLAALAVFSLAGSAFAAGSVKIASIDMRKIALESKNGVAMATELKKLKDKLEVDLKAKDVDLKKFLKSLEAKGKTLSAKEMDAKKKEAQKKYEKLQESAKNADKELQAKEEEFSGKVMARLEKIVKDYAVKNGYSLFIRKGDLVYTDGKNEIKDVTDDIMKIYDSEQQKPAK
jgi:outer membrane protein